MDMGNNLHCGMGDSNNMFLITIKTKYNVIRLEVEDYNTPEMQEIFDQPYVEEIKIDNIKKEECGKTRKLTKKP